MDGWIDGKQGRRSEERRVEVERQDEVGRGEKWDGAEKKVRGEGGERR